jgi:hypothetical protein
MRFDHIRLKPASNKLVDRRGTGRGEEPSEMVQLLGGQPIARSKSGHYLGEHLALIWTGSPPATGHKTDQTCHRERPQHPLMWQNVQTHQYAAEILRTYRIRRCRIKRPGAAELRRTRR